MSMHIMLNAFRKFCIFFNYQQLSQRDSGSPWISSRRLMQQVELGRCFQECQSLNEMCLQHLVTISAWEVVVAETWRSWRDGFSKFGWSRLWKICGEKPIVILQPCLSSLSLFFCTFFLSFIPFLYVYHSWL